MLDSKQLEERRKFIGASEAAAVLGLSRWDTPLRIWSVKTGQIAPQQEESLPMWVGTESEEMVARRFTLETGKKVRRVNNTIYHPEHPFLACHLDRKVEGENTILECKTASAFKYQEWEDEIPVEYIVQVYHQLACSGHKKAYIACLVGNTKFVIREIARDEKVIGDLVKKEVAFWNDFVIPKKMPGQIMAQDGDTLYQLFPQAEEGEAVKLDDQANMICESLDSLKVDLRLVKGTIEKQQNELKALLGKNEAGTTDHYRISWKNQSQNRLDTKRLKEDKPKIYAKYLKETKLRKLIISQIKEGEK